MLLLDEAPPAPFLDLGNLVNRAHPLADGLLGWWLCLSSLMKGTRLFNLMDNKVGTLTGMANSPSLTSGWGPTRRPGGFGELRCDGTNDYVSIADSPLFTFGAGGVDRPFSVSCCLWMTSIAATQGLLCKWTTYLTANEWIVYTANSELLFELYGTTDPIIGRKSTLTTGAHQSQWLSLVATYTGSGTMAGVALFLNGRRVDTTDSVTAGGSYLGQADTTAAVQVGAYGGAANFLNGKVDDIRIYKRALSPGEVLVLYQNQQQGYPGVLNRIPLFGRAPAVLTAALPPYQPWQLRGPILAM